MGSLIALQSRTMAAIATMGDLANACGWEIVFAPETPDEPIFVDREAS
jgi:hypothetical protein